MITHPTFTNYIIFRDGKVMNKTNGNIMKQRTNEKGYLRVGLYKDKKQYTKRVHRLVLETYNPIEDSHLYHAHHIDEIKHHNHIGNLRWELSGEHIREHKKGVRRSDETRKRMSESQKGRVVSEEHRRKLSESMRNMSDETRRRMSGWQKGKLLSEETRRRISEARTGSVCWNNGTKTIRSKTHPGDGWVRGRM